MFNTKPWNAGFPGIPKEVEQDISNLQSRAAALETANDFSTSETKIGKWRTYDLYRKVIDVGALPNATSKAVSSGISNFSEIRVIHVYGTARSSAGITLLIPHVNTASLDGSVGVSVNSAGEISISTGTDRSGYSGYVVLEYYRIPPTRDGDTEKEPEEVKEPETKTTKKAKKGE